MSRIVRISKGRYWEEMVLVRVPRCAATVMNRQIHCHEGGDSCGGSFPSQFVDAIIELTIRLGR